MTLNDDQSMWSYGQQPRPRAVKGTFGGRVVYVGRARPVTSQHQD